MGTCRLYKRVLTDHLRLSDLPDDEEGDLDEALSESLRLEELLFLETELTDLPGAELLLLA